MDVPLAISITASLVAFGVGLLVGRVLWWSSPGRDVATAAPEPVPVVAAGPQPRAVTAVESEPVAAEDEANVVSPRTAPDRDTVPVPVSDTLRRLAMAEEFARLRASLEERGPKP